MNSHGFHGHILVGTPIIKLRVYRIPITYQRPAGVPPKHKNPRHPMKGKTQSSVILIFFEKKLS